MKRSLIALLCGACWLVVPRACAADPAPDDRFFEAATLAAEAGHLHPTERRLGSRARARVDRHVSELQPLRTPSGAFGVAREHIFELHTEQVGVAETKATFHRRAD